MNEKKKFVIDLAERVGTTYAEGFVAFVLIHWTDITNYASALTVGKAAALAALPAALSLVKGVLAKFTGKSDSASLAPSVGTED